jgi:glycosyltransferase involved in cell wall biosynthesis
MVKLMLDGLRTGDHGDFEIHHIDARFSSSMEEVGTSGLNKGLLAFKYAFQAIRLRFRHGIKTLYYIPAPPKTSAMVRDWMILALCRPFFPVIVCHWHAVGLGLWTQETKERGGMKNRLMAKLNHLFLNKHAASLSLTKWGTRDTRVFSPQKTFIVPNGIPDPCPDFQDQLLDRRVRRREQLRSSEPTTYQIIYLGHCHGGKGLWDAMHAISIANEQLSTAARPLSLKLSAAGEFPTAEDRSKFDILSEELGTEQFQHLGFLGGDQKRAFFEQADCLCFPTKYEAESFGLVAAEALAFGIPPVCSDWRMVPDLMNMVGLPVAKTGKPESLARELIASVGRDDPATLRASFCEHFSETAHLDILADALRGASQRGNDGHS